VGISELQQGVQWGCTVTKALGPSMVATFLAANLLVRPAAAQDTIVVHAEDPPEWGSNVRVVEELRIGAVDGPDEYILGYIGSIGARRDGTIFVYDAQVPIIRQYSAAGDHVRDIGRKGQGPGEYRYVDGMQILGDGRLAVLDYGNQRVNVYDSAGVFLESHNYGRGYYGNNDFVVDSAGNFYIRVMAPAAPKSEGEEFGSVWLKLSASGELIDSIARPLADLALPPSAPFHDERVSVLSNRGYLVVGHNRSYALEVHESDDLVRRITRDADPEPVKSAEREQWEAVLEYADKRARERWGPEHGIDYPPLPRTKPFFRDLLVDADGRIWVDRYVAAEKVDVEPRESGDERPLLEWREPRTFDVIQPDGTFLGTLVLPKDTEAYYSRGMSIWGVYSGELGEPYVVRLRIEPGT
jgi:hypothetical protein